MPKLSVSVSDLHYNFLKAEVNPSFSKAVQAVTEEAMKSRGYIFVPGHWEKK